MRRLPLLIILSLAGCASGERTLSDIERERLGLTGIIYDARICGGRYNANRKDLDFTPHCEIVSCEPVNGKIVCKAKPEKPAPRGQSSRH